MATAYLKTPTFHAPPSLTSSPKTHKKLTFISFSKKKRCPNISSKLSFPNSSTKPFSKKLNFSLFASTNEKVETQESEIQEIVDDAPVTEDNETEVETGEPEEPVSIITSSLRSYREAITNDDESKAADIEAFLISIEDEKANFDNKVATLSEELSYERDRVLRISADFDNFRKRTERERLSLVTNAQGEVVESLLPVLDNFERAKSQLKIANEGEEKINNSYQSIYKQFVEILDSLKVVPVNPVGTPFDPLENSRVGSKFSKRLDELYQTFRKSCSGFLKAWIRL